MEIKERIKTRILKLRKEIKETEEQWDRLDNAGQTTLDLTWKLQAMRLEITQLERALEALK